MSQSSKYNYFQAKATPEEIDCEELSDVTLQLFLMAASNDAAAVDPYQV